MKIKSTTPESAIFEYVIKQDNDQHDIEEIDNNDIFLFEFEFEEEELVNEQHFALTNDLELTFNKN